jgi:uncharacterized membrane protein
MGGVMGLMMLLWMLIAAGALIFGVVGGNRVVKALRSRTTRPPALQAQPEVGEDAGRPLALEQAKERYARGEIDHAELERLLDVHFRADQRATNNR